LNAFVLLKVVEVDCKFFEHVSNVFLVAVLELHHVDHQVGVDAVVDLELLEIHAGVLLVLEFVLENVLQFGVQEGHFVFILTDFGETVSQVETGLDVFEFLNGGVEQVDHLEEGHLVDVGCDLHVAELLLLGDALLDDVDRGNVGTLELLAAIRALHL